MNRICYNKYLILFFCVINWVNSNGQVAGLVTDENGNPLSFATIYIDGTTIGAISNLDGLYELNMDDKRGDLTINCQYVGYATAQQEVKYAGQRTELNFQLRAEVMEIPTVEILANGEDPAYPIMRKAIARRKFHSKKIQSYTCESYIKGRFDVEEVPAMMKNMINDSRSMFDVDSNGRGIVYLSESESTFSKSPPDKVKEVMHSSLISGFDNQFSFNNAMSMDFSIYDTDMLMVRHLISPLANSAMTYYRFKLLGTTFDQAGNLLNKIQVIPKAATSPTFSGVIYIAEDKWSAPQADLVLTRDHAQQAMIDSVRFVYSSVEIEEDTWVDIKKHIWMRVKMFGLSASGSFNGVFQSYDMNPDFDQDFFNRELFAVQDESNQKSRAYWDSIRPIPLTDVETLNYTRMDSLKYVRKDRMDSIVKTPPKFKFINALNGYSRYFKNGQLQGSFTPLDEIGYNTVQGVHWGVGATLFSNPDSFHRAGFRVGMHANYAFSEERFRGGIHGAYLWNNDREEALRISAGRYINQYRHVPQLTEVANLVYTLFEAKNFAKYYEKDAVTISYERAGLDGIEIRTFAEIARRRALVNHAFDTWGEKRKLTSNNPFIPTDDAPAFQDNTSMTAGVELLFIFGQKYIRYPNRVFKMGSKYPVITLKASFNHNTTIDESFAHLQFGVSDDYSWKIAGDGAWSAKIGTFGLDMPTYFMDYRHVDGNETRFGLPSQYGRSFHLLPYYSYSTRDGYIEGHYQHHFRGFIMDKLPVLRRLKWNMAVGANYIYTGEQGMYTEVYAGLENIGINMFRFLRFDVVAAFTDERHVKTDYIIGIELGDFLSRRTTNKRQIRVGF